jgi:hypothetical protein
MVVVVVSIVSVVVVNILVLNSSITTTVTVITLLTYTTLRLVTFYLVVEGEIKRREIHTVLYNTRQKCISKILESRVIETIIYRISH